MKQIIHDVMIKTSDLFFSEYAAQRGRDMQTCVHVQLPRATCVRKQKFTALYARCGQFDWCIVTNMHCGKGLDVNARKGQLSLFALRLLSRRLQSYVV